MLQIDLLYRAANHLERLRIDYAIVGSYGLSPYGQPRSTEDIDILADIPPYLVKPFCECFPIQEYYVSEDAVRQAIAQRFQFNVLHNSTGLKIDFMMPRAGAWGERQLDRRVRHQLRPGEDVWVASVNDIIVGKLLYFSEGNSPKHLRDIKSILKVSGDKVNRPLIERWARQLGIEEDWNILLMLPEMEV